MEIMSSETNFQKTLYGNKPMTKIQRLYAMIYAREAKFGQHYDAEFLAKEIDGLWTKIQVEVDKLMPKVKAADRNKFFAIKGFSYYARGYKIAPEEKPKVKVDLLESALNVFEEIKNQPEGIRFYILALHIIALHHKENVRHEKSLSYLEKAEMAFKNFKNNFPDVDRAAWNKNRLFDVLEDKTVDAKGQSFKFLNELTMVKCFDIFNILKDSKKVQQYAVPSIEGKISMNSLKQSGQELEFCRLIPTISNEISALINSRHFLQVDHVLAGLWEHLTVYQRSEHLIMHPSLKMGLAIVSELYLSWAYQTMDHGGQARRRQDCATSNPIKTKLHKFKVFARVGVKLFEQQLPTAVVSAQKEYLDTIKKGKIWGQKALGYYGDPKKEQQVRKLLAELECLEHQYKEL